MSTSEGNAANRFAGRVKQAEDPFVKALRIKVNGLKRNMKDLEFAKKEVVCETARLESIRDANPDRVKQQENVIAEAQMMIPHSENRVRAAIKDLQDFLDTHENDAEEGELMQDARTTLESAQLILSKQ